MTGRNILALILAIVVGIIVIKAAFWLLGVVLGLFWWLVGAALIGGVVYFLYRKFNGMLASGRRLT